MPRANFKRLLFKDNFVRFMSIRVKQNLAKVQLELKKKIRASHAFSVIISSDLEKNAIRALLLNYLELCPKMSS